MTHKYVAITEVGTKFEQWCQSTKEALAIHQRLIDNGWKIQQYEIFEMEDGPQVQMPTNLH